MRRWAARAVWIVVATWTAGTAWGQERMVDTDGAIDLAGAVVVPSRWAVLMLFLAMLLLSIVGALLAQRSQERREAEETQRRLEARLATQDEELARLRDQLRDQLRDRPRPEPDKSSRPST